MPWIGMGAGASPGLRSGSSTAAPRARPNTWLPSRAIPGRQRKAQRRRVFAAQYSEELQRSDRESGIVVEGSQVLGRALISRDGQEEGSQESGKGAARSRAQGG